MADEKDERLSSEDEAAALAAGFDAARKGVSAYAEEPGEREEPQEQEEGQKGEVAASEAQEAPGTPEEEATIPGLGMTASEIRRHLDSVTEVREQTQQALQRAHGKIGELNRTVQTLAQVRQGGGPGKVNEKAYQKLKEEYGDELVEGIVNLFASSGEPAPEANQPTGQTQPQPTASEIEQIIEQRLQGEVAKVTDGFNERLLTVAHPDWREVAASPEFAKWRGTLSSERQRELEASRDATWVARQLTEFKQWNEARASVRPQTSGKANRLESAVAPPTAGAAAPAPKTDDPFKAGFYSARGT